MKQLICFLILTVISTFPLTAKSYEFSFSEGHDGWVGDYTDYPVGGETFYELAWGWESKGMFLSGNNHSDDLFMFIRRQIGGLKPDTRYALRFQIVLETNVPPGMHGIGGSPGESVYVKVGASLKRPEKVAKDSFYYLSVDKGNQSGSGKNAVVVGDLANPLVDPERLNFAPKHFQNEISLNIKTDKNGKIWIFVGTDSGFEGISKFYISKVDVGATVH